MDKTDCHATLAMTRKADYCGKKDSLNDDIKAEDIEKLSAEFCDKYCQYPNVCADEETLETVCDVCPMNKLFRIYDLLKGESPPSAEGDLLKPLDDMKVESWQDGIMRTFLGRG